MQPIDDILQIVYADQITMLELYARTVVHFLEHFHCWHKAVYMAILSSDATYRLPVVIVFRFGFWLRRAEWVREKRRKEEAVEYEEWFPLIQCSRLAVNRTKDFDVSETDVWKPHHSIWFQLFFSKLIEPTGRSHESRIHWLLGHFSATS